METVKGHVKSLSLEVTIKRNASGTHMHIQGGSAIAQVIEHLAKSEGHQRPNRASATTYGLRLWPQTYAIEEALGSRQNIRGTILGSWVLLCSDLGQDGGIDLHLPLPQSTEGCEMALDEITTTANRIFENYCKPMKFYGKVETEVAV